jgi:transposase
VSFPLHLSSLTRKQRSRRLQHASGSGKLRVVRRLQALRALADTQSVQEVAAMLPLGQHTLRDSRNALLLKGVSSLVDTRPPGRPRTFTPSQRRELATWSKAGPQAAGSPSGCWHTPMMQDRIQSRGGGADPPPSLATVLHNLGFASPQARVVAAPLHEAKRLEWRRTTWPKLV